jgi:hypothetical protein
MATVGFRYQPKRNVPTNLLRVSGTGPAPAYVGPTNLEHESGIEPLMAVLQTANLPFVDSCDLRRGFPRLCHLVRRTGLAPVRDFSQRGLSPPRLLFRTAAQNWSAA